MSFPHPGEKRNFRIFTDYFLTDPNETEEYAGSSYSQEELATLSERIERLEEKSDLLLSIPGLTVHERKEMMYPFIDNHEPVNKIGLQTIADAENGRSNLDAATLWTDQKMTSIISHHVL